MPEIKHQFTGGKMNKDLDERLVPNGEYRHAMNIQVATSEGSDVGTAQNILGNDDIDLGSALGQGATLEDAITVGAISDEKIDTMYYLVWSPRADYIISYNGVKCVAVFIDKDKNVLKLSPNTIITGINVIDGMLFWTDNINEPRKINIQRCVDATINGNDTLLLNNSTGAFSEMKEKHITVIKKGPQVAPDMKLYPNRDPSKVFTALINISSASDLAGIDNSFTNNPANNTWFDFQSVTTDAGSNEFYVNITEGLDSSGDIIDLSVSNINGLTGWFLNGATALSTLPLNTKVVLQAYNDDDTAPGLPLTDFVIKGMVISANPSGELGIKITTIDGAPESAIPGETRRYVIDLFDETEKLFEFKFPRFSYRYKYEDGEYSTFAPFTQVAFSPGSFDYHPRKGYNIGMTNKLSKVELFNIITSATPVDVTAIDVLFKDDSSPSVYVVDTIRPDDFSDVGSKNLWDKMLDSSSDVTVAKAGFIVEREVISNIVPSNQLLRPWDNVPKKALAQDITGNRIVYANYTQNYDLLSQNGTKYVPAFNVGVSTDAIDTAVYLDPSASLTTGTFKSIKSLREYQLGVVFLDEHGRETPVISNATGTTRINKIEGDKANRFEVEFSSDDYPQALTHFKFFVKETSSEYYNMAMDRFYSAGDGNIWLAFPSSDRNKIDIDTFLILKKGSDKDNLVTDAARYKVLAIESEAPDFIKTSKRKAFTKSHALVPTSSDIFGSGNTDVPFVNETSFKMRYQAFHATSGQDLAESKDELYIEFGKIGSDQTSERYKINSITNSWDGVAAITTTDVFSVELDVPLGPDVNFISDDILGNNPNIIEQGAIATIYKYKVENLDRFDGRFFVKIYFDEVFRSNIQSAALADKIKTTGERKVYSMDNDLVAKHTSNLGNVFTRGRGKPRDQYTSFSPQYYAGDTSAGGGQGDSSIHQYGYYAVDEFTASAFYFRRYREKVYSYEGGNNDYGSAQTWPGSGNASYKSSNKRLNVNYNVRALVHLVKGGTEGGTNLDHKARSYTSTSGAGTTVENDSFHIGYKGEFWKDEPKWYKEFGYGWDGGQQHKRAEGYLNWDSKGVVTMWQKYDGAYFSDGTGGYGEPYSFKETQSAGSYESDENSCQGTEVWFIDAGPHTGKSSSSSGMQEWNGNNTYDPGFGEGLTTFSGAWKMDLGFGGINGGMATPGSVGKWDIDGFWNIGDWSSSYPVENVNYTGSSITGFVSSINTGGQFRWKEDPDPTQVYTINSTVNDRSIMRHSDGPHLDVDGMVNNEGNSSDLWVEESIATAYANGNLLGSANNTNYLDYADNAALDLRSMAEGLSFNCSKRYKINGIEPAIGWNPMVVGEIPGGTTINLEIAGEALNSGDTVVGFICSGPNAEDLIIHVKDISVVQNGVRLTVREGMALISFERGDGSTFTGLNYWVVREIEEKLVGTDTFFALKLGGYEAPFLQVDHNDLLSTLLGTNSLVGYGQNNTVGPPVIGGVCTFVQVGMNGYSPNSEFNINTICRHAGGAADFGAITAVGYTLEFVEKIQATEVLSENPAIWETEPKDTTPLEIYYEASGAIPAVFNKKSAASAFPVGTKFTLPSLSQKFIVVGHNSNRIEVMNIDNPTVAPTAGAPDAIFNRPDDLIIHARIVQVFGSGPKWEVRVKSDLIGSKFVLPWHNCYSFGNGVESNRIRDNYNLPYISNGVKVSTTLEQEYKEEHRKYGLIYSGIYNAISGLNNLNQFIQAEKITKDVNPTYGSIQKLYSRDSDLVALCEDKILKIQANKDALFNADGKPQLIATDKVLGQTIPFAGEYGISTNPESFAEESYRAYFTDRVRGTVMRLSKDGLTPISDAGMKDWFRDNLRSSNKLIGSFDDRNDEYNLLLTNENFFTLPALTTGLDGVNLVTLTPGPLVTPTALPNGVGELFIKQQDWDDRGFDNILIVGGPVTLAETISGENMLPEDTIIVSINTNVTVNFSAGAFSKYTVVRISNLIKRQETIPPSSPQAQLQPNIQNLPGQGDSFLTLPLTVGFSIPPNRDNASLLSFNENVKGWVSFKSFVDMQMGISLANKYYTFYEGNLYVHYAKGDRNTFYNHFEPSLLEVVLNDDPGAVKVFNTLNYEGSQAKVDKFKYESQKVIPLQPNTDYSDQEYYNLYEKKGWSVESIVTNKEEGKINEFLEKEGKWFNGINKVVDTSVDVDSGDFTFQGLGFGEATYSGCTDPTANNYNPAASIDDQSCTYGPISTGLGCTDSEATNYDPAATTDDGSCVFATASDVFGCTSPNAINYDSSATIDDGSCNFSGPQPDEPPGVAPTPEPDVDETPPPAQARLASPASVGRVTRETNTRSARSSGSSSRSSSSSY